MIVRPTLSQITIISRRTMLTGAALVGSGALCATREMVETEPNIEGPYYKAGAPKRTLYEKGMPGTPFTLKGRVFDIKGNPVPGAVLDVWHADDAGQYDNTGYHLRGIVEADEKGVYKLETIYPKRYKVGENRYRPAHIHFKLRGQGVKELTTQVYFTGDEWNAKDSAWRQSLTVTPKDRGKSKEAKFNFVLRPA